MKKKVLLFLVLFLSLFFCKAYSTENTADNKGAAKPVLITKIKGNPQRPHSPSAQEINCMYIDGYLNFSFKYPEGICELTVSEQISGETYQYVFDSSSEAVIFVGELTEAHLLITTENGHSYQGSLSM